MSLSDYDHAIRKWKRDRGGDAWIGVDLDATLAEFTGWKGETHIGKPIPAMLARVKAWRAAGINVKIFTARAQDEDRLVLEAIEAWCVEHVGEKLPITCKKDYNMVEIWDDRAVQVIPNTGLRADGKEE